MSETGLSLRINPLFLLVLLIFFFGGMFFEVIIAFSLVLLHEFAHLLAAYKAGYKISKIELFPFGSLAEYNGLLELEPWQEIKVALAGPLFNLILGGIFFLLNFKGIFVKSDFLQLFIKYNLLIGIFNLIPALPLDGGRVLRALLVNKFGFQQGTLIAVKIAKTIAVFGGLVGFFIILYNQSNIWFLFLSFFVYGAAVKEQEQFIYRLMSYLTHRERIVKEIEVKAISSQIVGAEVPIKEVIYYINPIKYNLFYVLDFDLKIAGMITESQLINSFFKMKDRELRMIDLIRN